MEKIKMKIKEKRKIDTRRLIVKAFEDGLKKAIELVILGMVIGISFKLLSLTIVGVFGGSVLAKLFKITILEGRI